MRTGIAFIAALALGLAAAPTRANAWFLHGELERVNRCLHGRILDFTHNHGHDRRIWSAALCARRDLYVYLPPGYDPAKKYPLALLLHGAAQDERFFLTNLVKDLDRAIVDGTCTPCVMAVPDGSILGRPTFVKMATFFANSDAGRYEDYLMQDVWNFVMMNFSIRPERECHALLGASMGGAAAFTQAIKHKDRVKIAIGFMPALNLRWVDCHDRYNSPFDPNCWGWREKVRPFEVIGRPKGFKVRYCNLYGPTVGHGPDALMKLTLFNPIEVMERHGLKPGELDLCVAYGGKDEFNIPAQVESFLFRARELGLRVHVEYDPNGRHDEATARRLLPSVLRWVAPLVAH